MKIKESFGCANASNKRSREEPPAKKRSRIEQASQEQIRAIKKLPIPSDLKQDLIKQELMLPITWVRQQMDSPQPSLPQKSPAITISSNPPSPEPLAPAPLKTAKKPQESITSLRNRIKVLEQEKSALAQEVEDYKRSNQLLHAMFRESPTDPYLYVAPKEVFGSPTPYLCLSP